MKHQIFTPFLVTFIILFLCSLNSQAKEQAIDLTRCNSGTCTHLSEEDGLKAMRCEARSIGWSNNGYEALETFTAHEMGLLGFIDGQKNINTIIKWIDSDGDYFLTGLRSNKEDPNVRGGTGKWKGVKGDLKHEQIRTGKSLPQGTFMNCYRVTGTLELPGVTGTLELPD
jgi:hypothetical protein